MKKNILSLMSVLFVALAAFTFTSCGDDDDKNGGTPSTGFNNSLLGSWNDNYGHLFTFVMGPNGQITGSANGDAVTWYINTNGQLVGTEYDRDVKIYNYSLNGNQLTLTRVNDDDRETYVLYRSGSGGGGSDTPSGAVAPRDLWGTWNGSKTGDSDIYVFMFDHNGEGSKKEIDQYEHDLDFKHFTWTINNNGQLEIREYGDNELKIYNITLNGTNLTLTRVNDDDRDVYNLRKTFG